MPSCSISAPCFLLLLGKTISTHIFKDRDRDNIPKEILEKQGDCMSWQLPLLYMEFLRFYEVEIMKESTATALNVNIIKSHNSWFETKVTHIVSWPLFLSLLCTTQQTSVLKLHRCVSILQFVPASYYSKCSW